MGSCLGFNHLFYLYDVKDDLKEDKKKPRE